MYPYCFFNGEITNSDRALIKVNDISILRGFAAFDFMRIYNGNLFQFDAHMIRFKNTAEQMGLINPFPDTQIKSALQELVVKNKDKDYQVRFVLTGGETVNGLFPSIPIFYILFEKLSNLPEELYLKGAKLITHEYQRILPEAKNSNYMQAVLLQNKRLKEGAVEILYVSNGIVLEATTSNIFIVKDKVLYTPKENILKGITRKLVLDLAQKLTIKTVEQEIPIEELWLADEVFLSATNKKVLPITQIDSHTITDGCVGEITKNLLKAYNELI